MAFLFDICHNLHELSKFCPLPVVPTKIVSLHMTMFVCIEGARLFLCTDTKFIHQKLCMPLYRTILMVWGGECPSLIMVVGASVIIFGGMSLELDDVETGCWPLASFSMEYVLLRILSAIVSNLSSEMFCPCVESVLLSIKSIGYSIQMIARDIL